MNQNMFLSASVTLSLLKCVTTISFQARSLQPSQSDRQWPVIKRFGFPLHVIALIVSRVRCFLTAGCAVTCTHQAFLCLLGCLLSTLMAIGGCVQASPDHCSQSWVSGTDRRNRNHINPTQTKNKILHSLALYSKQKQESVSVFPFHQQHVSVRLIVVYWCFMEAVCHPHLLSEGTRQAPCENTTGVEDL